MKPTAESSKHSALSVGRASPSQYISLLRSTASLSFYSISLRYYDTLRWHWLTSLVVHDNTRWVWTVCYARILSANVCYVSLLICYVFVIKLLWWTVLSWHYLWRILVIQTYDLTKQIYTAISNTL